MPTGDLKSGLKNPAFNLTRDVINGNLKAAKDTKSALTKDLDKLREEFELLKVQNNHRSNKDTVTLTKLDNDMSAKYTTMRAKQLELDKASEAKKHEKLSAHKLIKMAQVRDKAYAKAEKPMNDLVDKHLLTAEKANEVKGIIAPFGNAPFTFEQINGFVSGKAPNAMQLPVMPPRPDARFSLEQAHEINRPYQVKPEDRLV